MKRIDLLSNISGACGGSRSHRKLADDSKKSYDRRDMDEIYKTIKEFGKVRLNEPMSKHTTFKIGGPATYFIIVETVDNLVELFKYLDGKGIDYMILGGGSNMLVSDAGFDGVVIQIKDNDIHIDGTTLTASAGASTVTVAQESMKAGLTGFEWGVGVPGTIGGAVRGNAGATGFEMKDNVSSVEVYKDGEVITYSNEECQFEYRHSIFKKGGGFVLRVILALAKAENKESAKKALNVLQYRNETQPKGYASTGCIFKNVELDKEKEELLKKHFDVLDEKVKNFLEKNIISAGWLVEQAGLKGKKVGAAQVSDVHGNFIINTGNASAQDVLSLIEEIKETVYDKFELALQEEIQII